MLGQNFGAAENVPTFIINEECDNIKCHLINQWFNKHYSTSDWKVGIWTTS